MCHGCVVYRTSFLVVWKVIMTCRVPGRESDVLHLEVLNEKDSKAAILSELDSSNEELPLDSKSEILWSCENNFFTERDFFHDFGDNSSGLTERTASSCSWHNDDFDMNSSNRVKASLEGIEDALYEQKLSPFISQCIYEECYDWSSRFPYFRLKGQQVVKPVNDCISFYASTQRNAVQKTEVSPLNLQVEGKKMFIHGMDSAPKKFSLSHHTHDPNEGAAYMEEVFELDGEYEELLALDDRRNCCAPKDLGDDCVVSESAKDIKDKVIEKIALNMWPMVLSILQNVHESSSYDAFEGFLPPIVRSSDRQRLPCQRPRTEGTTDVLALDFPSLSSILTISPKVLQNKDESSNLKQDLRPSRPNSEINFSRRRQPVPCLRKKQEAPLRVPSAISQLSSFLQVQSLSRKHPSKEGTSQLLPALEEDPPESIDALLCHRPSTQSREFPVRCEIAYPRAESFLPPIERRTPSSANVKLTRNLFTLFGSDLKCDKVGDDALRISRPNTSASRKGFKSSGHPGQKLPGRPSTNSSSPKGKVRQSELKEKQVTLFPIVTSLVANKDRLSAKKGPLTSFTNKRKR